MKQCRLGLILVLLLFFALSACKGTDIENAAQTQTFFETERDRKLQETSKARWEDIDEDSDASLEDSREESDTPPFSEEEAAETVADGSGRAVGSSLLAVIRKLILCRNFNTLSATAGFMFMT